MVLLQIPKQQGLKLCIINILIKWNWSSFTDSKTTRIETLLYIFSIFIVKCSFTDSKTTRIETYHYSYYQKNYLCSFTDSKTTRIETNNPMVFSRVCGIVLLQIPKQQGLKLTESRMANIRNIRFFYRFQNNKDWNFYLIIDVYFVCFVLLQIPKQQGLKHCMGEGKRINEVKFFYRFQNNKDWNN